MSRVQWITVISALATYAALCSSWLMALPAQRAAVLQGNIALIEAQLSTEEVERTMQLSVIANMKARVAAATAKDKNLIFRGQCWLICSFALFTLAVALGF